MSFEINGKSFKEDAWGHLAPKSNKKYFGWIIIAIWIYNYKETIIVDNFFSGLDNSPWQYADFVDFINHETSQFDSGIYKFDGWYMNYGLDKDNNYHISGKFMKLSI